MKRLFSSEEPSRQKALHRYAILDTAAERSYDDLTQLAAYIAKSPMALISFVDKDRQWFKSRVGVDMTETPRSLSFCAHAIQEPTDMFVIPDTHADPRFADHLYVKTDPNIRFYCGAPLVTPDNQALGTLCVIDRVPRTLDSEQTEALEALSRQVMMLLELRRLSNDMFEENGAQLRTVRKLEAYQREMNFAYGQLREESQTDALTGIANRAAFEARLDFEMRRARRSQRPLSLIVADADHFKAVNDTFGHAAGDQALRMIAKGLSCLRPNDFLARYGGEEFVALLPETDADEASRIAERLRSAVAHVNFEHRPTTISLGVATLSGSEPSRSLFEQADLALYAAKRQGRNRIVHADALARQDATETKRRLAAG